MSRLSYKTLFIILFFLLIPIVFLLKTNQRPNPAAAGWWDEAWSYRQRIDITGTSTNLTDFQVSINIGTSALIASGKMKNDCSDIRFTDNTGNILPYWIEENNPGCNQLTDTKIWIKAPSVPTTGTAIYLYYGNSQAQSTQNGNDVFEFFDDFDDNDITDWTQQPGSTWTVNSGIVATTSDGKIMYHDLPSALNTGIIIMGRSRIIHTQYWNDVGIGIGNSSFNGYNNTIGYEHATRGHLTTNGARVTAWTATTNWTINTSFYVNEYSYDGNGHHVAKCYDNGNSVSWTDTTHTNMDKITLYHQTFSTGARGGEYDWITARKFSSTDPTPTLQSEEVGTAPIAYWKFDEGVGTTAHDSSSSQVHASFTGATYPTWLDESQCISGKCLRLSSDSSSLWARYPNSFSPDSQPFSISMWFYANSFAVPDAPELMKFNIGGSGWVSLRVGYNNELEFQVKGYNGTLMEINSPDNYLSTNQWYHLTAVYDPTGTSKLFINGTQMSQTSTTNVGSMPKGSTLTIGKGFNAWELDGRIDEVKIYPYARSADQAKADYATQNSSVSFSNSSASSLTSGLVGYWKFDEGVGSTTADSSGNNLATFAAGDSSPSWGSGKFGTSPNFDGINDYINIGQSAGDLVEGNEFTVSVWFKADAALSSIDGIISKDTTSPYAFALRRHSVSSNLEFLMNNNGLQSTLIPTVGRWYHVVLTYSNTTGRSFYVDSQLNASDSYKTNATSNNDNLYLGVNYLPNSGRNFDGSIDEVRIYNRALSQSEVSDLYNFAPGPVAYYNFENISNTTIKDISGGHNGTNTNAIVSTGKFGNSLYFNGNSSVGTSASNEFNMIGDLTLSAWVKTNSTAVHQHIVGTQNYSGTGSPRYSLFILTTGKASVYVADGTGTSPQSIIGNKTVNDGNWHHFEVVFNKNSALLSLYIDGALDTSTTLTKLGPYSTNGGIVIGGGTPFFATGSIDDVKIYNYARTQKQILQDMQGDVSSSTKLSGPIVHYKFDEGQGSTVNNSGFGGASLIGTLGAGSSSPTWALGKSNKGLSFNGSNNYIDFGDVLNFSGKAQTISSWIKLSSQAGTGYSQEILARRSPTTSLADYGFGIGATGNLNYYFYNSGWKTCQSTGSVAINTWTNVTVTFDGTTNAIFYINGKYDSTCSLNSSITSNASNVLRIGYNFYPANNKFFNGAIDEVKIYNYALTPDEVKTDYNQGSSFVFGSSNQTIGGTTTSLDYCVPGDASACSAPVAEWNFEEGIGTTAYDSSGNNINLRIYNAQSTTGKVGKSLSFTGTNSYATYPDPGTTPLDITGNVTLQAWVKWREFKNYGSIAQKGNGGGAASFNYALWSYSNNVTAIIANGTSNQAVSWASSNISLNQWHHVSLVADGSYLRLYVDGIQRASTAQTITPSPSDSPFSVSENNSSINADIDQVRVYNYARTPAQIAYDYSKGAPIAHFKFDECQGNVSHSSTGVGITGSINIGSSGTQSTVGTCTTTGAWANGTSGKINSSLNFDGTDDYVEVADNDLYTLQQFSFSTWFKWNGTRYSSPNDWAALITKGNYSAGEYTILMNRDSSNATNQINLYLNGSQRASFTPTLDTGWHHLTVTSNGSTNTIYLDGQYKTENNFATTITNTTNNINIGRQANNSYKWGGQIDDVRIYNYPLTAEQVKQIYNGGSANFQSP